MCLSVWVFVCALGLALIMSREKKRIYRCNINNISSKSRSGFRDLIFDGRHLNRKRRIYVTYSYEHWSPGSSTTSANVMNKKKQKAQCLNLVLSTFPFAFIQKVLCIVGLFTYQNTIGEGWMGWIVWSGEISTDMCKGRRPEIGCVQTYNFVKYHLFDLFYVWGKNFV